MMEASKRNRFNIRVYGILIKENGLILLSDEIVFDRLITKFPGGGLEFGEGPEDCIIREAKEELGVTVRLEQHFYTTGFFQPSAFRDNEQVISIYYRIGTKSEIPEERIHHSPSELELKEGAEALRWVQMEELDEKEMDLPIDKKVVAMLRENFA